MNKTKKRALLSAIAMLVVSAVVLSSATFAWFTVGDQATVELITAGVKTESSIEISATGAVNTWGGNLAISDLSGRGDNSFQSPMKAISGNPLTSAMSFFTGDLQNTKLFTAAPAGTVEKGTSLVKFTFYLKAEETTPVKFTGTTLTGNALSATYVAMQIGDDATTAASKTPLVFSGATDNTYFPITGAGTATDSNSNGIIQAGEPSGTIPCSVGTTAVTCKTFADVTNTFTLNAGVVRQVIVYMWLEGNDPQCTLTGVTGDATLTLNFAKA